MKEERQKVNKMVAFQTPGPLPHPTNPMSLFDPWVQSATGAMRGSLGTDNGVMLCVLMKFRTLSERIHAHV